MSLKWDATDKIDQGMKEDDIVVVFVGEWFGREPLSNIHKAVDVASSNYALKRFTNTTALPYHLLYRNRFCSNEKDPKHRLCGETVEYN